MSECVFCEIAKGGLLSYPVYQDNDFMAFLDIKPINPGHVVLVPKEHYEYVFDLPGEVYTKIMDAAKKLAGPIRKATGSKRVSMAVEGFGVNHAHIHLIPVNGLGEMNPQRAHFSKPDELKSWADKIKQAM